MAEVQQRLVFIVAARDDNTRRVMESVQRALEETGNAGARVSRQLKASFSGLGKSIASSASGLNRSVLNIRNAIVASGIVAGLGTAAKASLDFGKGLAEISAIVGDVKRDMPVAEESIRRVAVAFGLTHADTVKAQYDIISSGFEDASEAAKILEVSAKLARAGVSEIGPTADLMTTIINGFGLSVNDAEHAADVLFKTVQVGKVTVPELAQHLGEVSSTARLAGVNLEEVGAAMASLTIAGVGTPEAVTSLRSLFLGLAAPSKEAAQTMEDLHLRFTEVGADGRKQLIPLLDVIEKFRGLDLDVIRKIVPNVRAIKALGTLSENFDQFKETYDEFTDAAQTKGTLEEAFARATDNAGFSIDQLRSAFHDLLIEFGGGFTDELAAGAKDLLTNFDELKKKAREFGEETGEAIKKTVLFVKEYSSEIKKLIEAYIALRALIVLVEAISAIAGIIKWVRLAIIATNLWATGMRGLLAATLAVEAALGLAVLAVGVLIAKPLGRWLGEAIGGTKELSAELAIFTDNASAAAAEFENNFLQVIGKGSEEAKKLHSEGTAVLVEDMEAYDRATGKAVDSAEEVAAANEKLGVGFRVVSGELIDVRQAAIDAADAYTKAGDGAVTLDEASKKIADQVGVSAEVIQRLPEAVRQSFQDAANEIRQAQTDLDNFKNRANEIAEDIQVNQMTGDEDEVKRLQAEMADLQTKLPSVEKGLRQSEDRLAGLQKTVREGATEEARAAEARKKQEEDEARGRKARAAAAHAARLKEIEREAKALAKARARAHDDFIKISQRESAAAAESLRDRLEEVKAFARDSGAAVSRMEVTGTVAREVADAAKEQIDDAFDVVNDKVKSDLSDLERTISESMEDGVGFEKLAPTVAKGLGDAARDFEKLRVKALLEATASKEDLLSVVEGLRDGLLQSGTATEEQLAAVMADPFNRDAWADSAKGAGVSVDEMQRQLQGFADAVIYMRTQMRAVDEQTNKLAEDIRRNAVEEVRDFVDGLDDLNVEQLRLLESTLATNDAIDVAARKLIEARIAALEGAAMLKDFTKEADKLVKSFRVPDNAGPLTRLRAALGKASTGVNELRRSFDALPDNIQKTDDVATELVGTFEGIGDSLENQGIVALLRLRREVKKFQEDIDNAGLPSGEPSEAASTLTKNIKQEIVSDITSAAKTAGLAVAGAMVSATRWIAGQVKSLISLAADSEQVADFVQNLKTTLPATISALSENLQTVVDGLLESAPAIVSALSQAIPAVASTLASALPAIAQEIVDQLPDLATSLVKSLGDLAVSLLSSLKSLIPQLATAIIQTLPAVADAVTGILSGIGDLLPTLVRSAVRLVAEGVPQLLSGVLKGLPDLLGGIFDGVVSLIEGAVTLLAETLPKVIKQVFAALPGLIKGILGGVTDIVKAILVTLIPSIPDIVVSIIRSVIEGVPEIIIAFTVGIIKMIPEIIVAVVQGYIKAVPEILAAVLVEIPGMVIAFMLEMIAAVPRVAAAFMTQIAKFLATFLRHPFKAIGNLIAAPFVAFAKPFQEAWEGIMQSFEDVADSFRDFFSALDRLWTAVKDVWDAITDSIDGLKDFLDEFLDRLNPLTTKEGDPSKLARAINFINPFDNQDTEQGPVGKFIDKVGDGIKKGLEKVGDLFSRDSGGGSRNRSSGAGRARGRSQSGLGVREEEQLRRAASAVLPRFPTTGGPRSSALPHPVVGNTPEETERFIRKMTRAGIAQRPQVNFNGGAVFASDAAGVVDEITSRGYKLGNRTGRLLNKRYGTMPGQRRS